MQVIGNSIYDQKVSNPKKLMQQVVLADFFRICHVEWHTESMLDSDLGKAVVSKMAYKMGVTILE